MPASEHRFSEVPPSDLYIDTDLIVSFLVETEPHHHRCKAFLANLETYDRTTVYLSGLSWVEFIHVVSRERFRRNLSDDLQRQLRVHRWNEPLVRQAYIRSFVRRLEAILTQFTWIEIDLTPEIRRRAIDYIAQYNLSGQDAIHLACALNAGVTDLASFDGGFRRVEGVHLWNDLIHAK